MLPIADIAARLGLPDEFLEPCGRHVAKIRLDVLEKFPERRGKLILVTAITPTTSGEGKTVNTIGITQGLIKRGHKAVAALREVVAASGIRRDSAESGRVRPSPARSPASSGRIQAPSRIARTLFATSAGENGFSRRFVPGSSAPCRASASSV